LKELNVKHFLRYFFWVGCLGAATAAPVLPVAAQQPLAAAPAAAAGQGSVTEDLANLLKRQDAGAVVELGRRFAASAVKLDKQKIAEVLLSRRQGDQPYFDFLAGFARQAVASDAPFPYGFDAAGKLIPGKFSAEFLAWAAARKVEPANAVPKVFAEYPMDVYLLALTGDPRGTELLLKGLASPNFLVAYRSAFGLAKLQAKGAIPAIIAAADRAPGEGSELIARTLVLFEDPAAQAAAERLIKNKQLLQALRSNAQRELTLNIGDS
jgi:hypothetical protein